MGHRIRGPEPGALYQFADRLFFASISAPEAQGGEKIMELRVEVVRVEEVTKHDNADSLDIVKVFDYPVVARRGDFQPGDLAVYVPIDAVVPFTEDWAWLHGGFSKHCRVQAKRLRGVFSMGLLVKTSDAFGQVCDRRRSNDLPMSFEL